MKLNRINQSKREVQMESQKSPKKYQARNKSIIKYQLLQKYLQSLHSEKSTLKIPFFFKFLQEFMELRFQKSTGKVIFFNIFTSIHGTCKNVEKKWNETFFGTWDFSGTFLEHKFHENL